MDNQGDGKTDHDINPEPPRKHSSENGKTPPEPSQLPGAETRETKDVHRWIDRMTNRLSQIDQAFVEELIAAGTLTDDRTQQVLKNCREPKRSALVYAMVRTANKATLRLLNPYLTAYMQRTLQDSRDIRRHRQYTAAVELMQWVREKLPIDEAILAQEMQQEILNKDELERLQSRIQKLACPTARHRFQSRLNYLRKESVPGV